MAALRRRLGGAAPIPLRRSPAAGSRTGGRADARLAFKPIIGCEVYVARRRLQDKEGKPDQSGYHLILLAKNLKGYHNLIKIVSKAWTEGFYMRPRTDRVGDREIPRGADLLFGLSGGRGAARHHGQRPAKRPRSRS